LRSAFQNAKCANQTQAQQPSASIASAAMDLACQTTAALLVFRTRPECSQFLSLSTAPHGTEPAVARQH
jgi:hypothetical protein